MPDSQVDEIKNRLDVTDIIRGYMKIEKSGANLRGLCPFHKEKTPSFFVSPSRQLWKCFGCGVGGDMFTFVEQIDGVDFKEALQILADRAGVQLKSYDPKVRSEKSRVYEICENACQFFEKQLAVTSLGQEGKQYLFDRGINEESIKKFRLGFAPNTRAALYDYLRGQGYSPSEVFKSGVALQTGGDRFRGRIIFPIFDYNSQVIGFGGRIFFAKNQIPDKNLAKYINTPQTILYDKSRVLYGLDQAKGKIREEGCCILMEGYTDVIMAHQSGSENAVGVSGTALTEQQLDLVHRYTENIMTSFDMDIAGDNATKRGIEIAQQKGFNIKVILLPEGKDPAELIQKDAGAWKKSVGKAFSIGDFYFYTALARFDKKIPEGQKNIAKIVLPMIKHIPTQIEQSFWVQKLATEFSCAENVIWNDLAKIFTPSKSSDAPLHNTKNSAPITPKGRRDLLYERLLILLAREKKLGDLMPKNDLSLLASSHPLAGIIIKTCRQESLCVGEQKLLESLLFADEIFPVTASPDDCASEFKMCLENIRELEFKEKLIGLQYELRKNPDDQVLLEKFQKISIKLAKL